MTNLLCVRPLRPSVATLALHRGKSNPAQRVSHVPEQAPRKVTLTQRPALLTPRGVTYIAGMTATLHLMKLCVGAPHPEALESWQRARFGAAPAEHVTRMWPKREAELLDGGSLYWVFKGAMLARQKLLGLEERTGADGIRRCALILDPQVVRVSGVPRRAFQGWRYLQPADAPPDLPASRALETTLPAKLARELAEMGLL